MLLLLLLLLALLLLQLPAGFSFFTKKGERDFVLH